MGAAFAIAVAVYSTWCYSGDQRIYRLWYYVPAAVLAGLVVAERFTRGRHSKASLGLDLLVAATCLARPIFEQPPLSGHALFSVFSLATCRTASCRLAAIAVLLITLYAKIVLWHFDPTLWPGLAAGVVAGLGWRILESRATAQGTA